MITDAIRRQATGLLETATAAYDGDRTLGVLVAYAALAFAVGPPAADVATSRARATAMLDLAAACALASGWTNDDFEACGRRSFAEAVLTMANGEAQAVKGS